MEQRWQLRSKRPLAMNSISVYRPTPYSLRAKRIEEIVRRIARFVGFTKLELGIRFLTPKASTRINLSYRGKPRPANILTFVYRKGMIAQGDILLCFPIIRKEAKKQGLSEKDFLQQLLLHGLLHIKGKEHRTFSERKRMEKKEHVLFEKVKRR